MSYYRRLSEDAQRAREQINNYRRAQDHVDDGFGLLRCGMGIIGVIVVVGLIWRVLG